LGVKDVGIFLAIEKMIIKCSFSTFDNH